MHFLTETLVLIFAIILLFTLIYYFLEHWDLIESFYSSVMITTLVGKAQPRKNVTKMLMTVQALLSFIIAGQMIVFFSGNNKSSKDSV